MARINVAVAGHSFVRRLATFSLAHRSLNLDLDERYQVTFISRGGLKVQQLYSLTQDIVSASRDVVFLDIGTNDLANSTSVDVGDKVLAFASYLTVMAEVRSVVISHMFYRDSALSLYPVDDDFNTRVFLYNKYMFEATKSFDNIHFWSHKGVWSNWQQYLLDGVHFNDAGNTKYFNSVRGAVIAAANKF